MKKNILFFCLCCLMGMSIEMMAPAKNKKGTLSSEEEAALLAYQQGNPQQGLTKKQKRDLKEQEQREKIRAEKACNSEGRKDILLQTQAAVVQREIDGYLKNMQAGFSAGTTSGMLHDGFCAGKNARNNRKKLAKVEEMFSEVL